MALLLDWQTYQADQLAFKDKVIMVTGAAGGMGRSITIALAKHGATVIMLDKKSRHLEKLFDQIMQRGYVEPVILPVDLLEVTPETATELAQATYDDFGKLDGLLHNAAELGSPSPLDQYDLKYWNEVMHTNLQAPYFLTRALLPLLKQDTPTNVLFTTADVARQPQAYWGAYAIAYAGLEAQMKIWAEELENISKVKINSIDPGPVRTSFRRRSHPGESQDSLMSPQVISSAYLMMLENTKLHGEKLCAQKIKPS